MRILFISILVFTFSYALRAQDERIAGIDRYEKELLGLIQKAEGKNAADAPYCTEVRVNVHRKSNSAGTYYKTIRFWYSGIPDPESEQALQPLQMVETETHFAGGKTGRMRFVFREGSLALIVAGEGGPEEERWYFDDYSFFTYMNNKQEKDPELASMYHEGLVNQSQDLTSLFINSFR